MTNTVTVVVPADLISVNNNSLTLTLHLSLEENAASNTDHRYSFTYPWREQGRHHRPSVQFYLPMKVMKRTRQAPQTISTVLLTHESREESEAGNTDHWYSFTYPWREWGRQHRLWVQFYLPMKRMRQATQTMGTVLPTHEENEAGNTDYQYSFTYPWREWGRQHRLSVQFYLPMKVVKRMRETPQTMGTVLPTQESRAVTSAAFGFLWRPPRCLETSACEEVLSSVPSKAQPILNNASIELQFSSFMIVNSATAVCISWEGMDLSDQVTVWSLVAIFIWWEFMDLFKEFYGICDH